MSGATTGRPGPAPHLPDGELVRLLDGELAADARARAAAHLAGCAACAGRLDALRERSALVRAMLDEPPSAAPDAWLAPARRARARRAGRSRAWWRGPRGVAAAAAAALVVALLAPPVYAAVRRWVEARLAPPSAAPPVAAAPAPAAPADPQPAARTTVRFASDGDAVRLRFAVADPGATLVVVRGDAREAVLAVEGAAAAAAPVLVLPDGADVRNPAAAGGAYRLAVPAGVRTVRVSVAGRDVAVVQGAELAAPGRAVPLGAP